MRILITGGAGFIGSNLAEYLYGDGHEVTVYDDLSLGTREFLDDLADKQHFRFVEGDLLDAELLQQTMVRHHAVFHLAANSDISRGRLFTDTDLRQGTLATYNVLAAMRKTEVRQILFASSSVIYGEPDVFPTPENYGPLLPISLYGASKLACEGLISAFCHNYGLQSWIFRFANICGRHGTHGAFVDFIRKLQNDPRHLEVLGDGNQSKPYLHVSDCIRGMLFGWKNAAESVNVFNLGCAGSTQVHKLATQVITAMGLTSVDLVYRGGARGWPGDVPKVQLDCSKLERLGWAASMSSDEAVDLAANQLVEELSCKSLS